MSLTNKEIVFRWQGLFILVGQLLLILTLVRLTASQIAIPHHGHTKVKLPQPENWYIATSASDKEKPLNKNCSSKPAQCMVVVYLLLSMVIFVRTHVKVQRSCESIFLDIFGVACALVFKWSDATLLLCPPPTLIKTLANTLFSMISLFILCSASSFLFFIIYYITIQFSSEFLQANQC